MSYHQTLAQCDSLTINADALKTFQATSYPPLAYAQRQDDIPDYKQAAVRVAHLKDILIFGTGGSSLGAKTLCALSLSDKPRLHFIDNIDPHTFAALFKKIELPTTGLLIVSKSGSTVETLMQTATFLQHFGRIDPAHVLVITEPTQNPLRALATKNQWMCLDHPTNVGGRYSCFSVVGLLPMILAGLDPFAFRKGAAEVLETHLTSSEPPALVGAAASLAKPLSVIMPYADQLQAFALWHRQLWAESVGKKGKGTTPINALGTVDQHSQLQLYLDGPKDKFFTLIGVNWQNKGPVISEGDFAGKTMGDLLLAEQRATLQTLINNGCPTRLITLDKLDEYHFGALMMHFMIETILASAMLGVDAFNQPAVEEGKRLAREYLYA